LAYAEMNQLDFPITNVIHDEVLSLPISPVTTIKEVQSVIEVLNRFK
jgi:dTDP-4-amino-4,6-dideoxygalactose transaminase